MANDKTWLYERFLKDRDLTGKRKSLNEVVDLWKREIVVQSLAEHGLNRSKVASDLRVPYRSLFNMIKRWGLPQCRLVPDFRLDAKAFEKWDFGLRTMRRFLRDS